MPNLVTFTDVSAVIFDIDGTLLATDERLNRAWVAFGQSVGISDATMVAVMRDNRGIRVIDTMNELVPHFTESELQAAHDEYWEWQFATSDGIGLIAGAQKLLRDLRNLEDQGLVRVGYVTGAPAEMGRHFEAVGLPAPRPGTVIGANDVSVGKPDPSGHLKIASILDVDPAKCVGIGDSPNDVNAAKRAGMKTVSLLTSHTALEVEGADVLVHDLRDVTVRQAGRTTTLECSVSA